MSRRPRASSVPTAPRGTTVTRLLPLPASEAWRLVSDPRHHARWIPLTRVVARGLPLGVGTVVTAVSGPLARRGAPGFPDRMRIDAFTAPRRGRAGEAVFTKIGPVLGGTARIRVAPVDRGHAAVTWNEDVHLAGPLPRSLTRAALTPVLGLMLRFALRRLAREVADRRPA